MKSWSPWFRRRRSKRINLSKSRPLRGEFLEPRQLLAGDILQTASAPLIDGAAFVAREPRAALSLDAKIDLSLEGDSNERQIAAIATEFANAAIASAPNGDYIVIRQQATNRNYGWDLFGQRYDEIGNKIGSVFPVNADRRGDQVNPQIAIASDGSFTVVFQSEMEGDWEVMARSFDANGEPTRTYEFAINSNVRGHQVNPSVAYLDSATFVVVWNGRGDGVRADEDGIFAQRVRFNDPVGLPIRVNLYTKGAQAKPVVAATSEGDFVIAWEGRGEGDPYGIYMRKFFVSDDGDISRSRQIRVNSSTTGRDSDPALSINPDDGSLVIAWENYAGDERWNVRAQAFTDRLKPVGGTVEVNQTRTQNQRHPAITHIDGDYVIVWEGLGAEDRRGIYARRFTAVGEAVGGEVLINKRNLDGEQRAAAVATVGDGIQIVWDGPTAAGTHGVFRRGLREADLNEAPTIESLANATTLLNTPFTFNVIVNDADTPTEQLVIRVRPNNGATVAVDENDPTLFTITPATDFRGRVNVPITVSDGVNELVRGRFSLEVDDNLPPTIAPIDDLVIPADQAEAIINFIVTDDEDQIDDDDQLVITRIIESGDASVIVDQATSRLRVIPDPDFVGDIVTTLVAFDGLRRSHETFTVTVSAVPTVDLNGDEPGGNATTTFFANAALGAQSAGILDIDVNDDNDALLSNARVVLDIRDTGFEELSVNVLDTDIIQSYNPATGIMTLFGQDTVDNYERVLRTLVYTNNAPTPEATARVVSITVNDGVQDSETRTALIAIENNTHVDLVEMAKRIAESGSKFFGAHWCQHCTDQKEAFQDGQKFLPFLEVTNPDRSPNALGIEEGIETYPTWEFPDGTRLTGFQDIGVLAALSGVDIPATPTGENNTPYIMEIEDKTVLVGSPLLVSLDGYDPDGDDLTYTVTSSNPDIVPILQEGNRSVRINVEGFGDMVLELLEDNAPLATARMIELATNTTRTVMEGEGDDAVEMEIPFYQDITFHRVINDFVIQAGDPEGTGGGGSDLGDFDDQFDFDLQLNQSGILAMAKSDDDTNDSQFFITEGASRHLDFNHTVFGFLVEGESNRDSISNTDVVGGRPIIAVTIESVDVFEDMENAVVLLKANEGATGTSTITVTATDGSGGTVTEVFEVTLEEDTFNGGPVLVPFEDELETLINTPITFDLDAVDIEGDAVFFDIGFVNADQATVEIDNDTGVVTVTPATDFSGFVSFLVGVRPADNVPSDTTDRFDAQEVSIAVGDAERLFPAVTQGSFDDAELLGVRTDLEDGAPEITNDHVQVAIDYVADGYSNPPTYGPHHGPVNDNEGNSITPRPTGVYTTEQPDEDLVHNLEHGLVWISYNPSLISEADRIALEDFVRDGGTDAGVILTPRPKNDSAIAVASWARLLELDSFDDAQIREFVETNRGHAPEGYIPTGQKPVDQEVFDDMFDHLDAP